MVYFHHCIFTVKIVCDHNKYINILTHSLTLGGEANQEKVGLKTDKLN